MNVTPSLLPPIIAGVLVIVGLISIGISKLFAARKERGQISSTMLKLKTRYGK